MAPAMPCKRMDNQHNCLTKVKAEPKDGKENSFFLKKCMVALWNATNPRDSEQNLCSQKIMKTSGKGFTSMTHYNLVHKFLPMLQAMKIPNAKAAVDKEWKKLETIPVWNLEKVKSKKEVILKAHRDKKKVHFA